MTTVLDHAPIARDGFDRLGPDMVTSIDQAGHTGIDGIYYKDTPEGPQYQIIDQKYATNENWSRSSASAESGPREPHSNARQDKP